MGDWARRHPYLTIFIVAIVIRFANIATLPWSADVLLAEDASIYWNGAGVILEHGQIGRIGADGIVPETERVPGYMLFLAATRLLTSNALAGTLAVQALLDGLTCVMIATMGSLISARMSLVTGILAALWPNMIIHAGMILSDSFFLFLFTGVLAAGVQFLATAQMRWACLAGLCLGCAIMTRSVAVLLPVLMLPIAFGVSFKKFRSTTTAMATAGVFFILAAAPTAPWLYRNVTSFDALSLTSQNGTHLAGWVVPLVRRAHDGTPRDIGSMELQQGFEQERVSQLSQGPFKASQLLANFAMEKLVEYPVTAIVKAWMNGALINFAAPPLLIDRRVRDLPHASFDSSAGAGLYAQTKNFLMSSSVAFVVIATIGMFAAFVMAGTQCFGALILLRTYFWPAIFSLLCVGYFLALNGPVGSPKYRLPFEPVLIIWTAIPLLAVYDRLKPASQN